VNVSSVCTVALFIQHAVRLRYVILPNMACLAVTCSYTLCHKWNHFGEEIITKSLFLFPLQLGLKLSQ